MPTAGGSERGYGPGASVTRALDAVLSVMPLDDFVPEATWRMQVVDQADQQAPKL